MKHRFRLSFFLLLSFFLFFLPSLFLRNTVLGHYSKGKNRYRPFWFGHILQIVTTYLINFIQKFLLTNQYTLLFLTGFSDLHYFSKFRPLSFTLTFLFFNSRSKTGPSSHLLSVNYRRNFPPQTSTRKMSKTLDLDPTQTGHSVCVG